MKPFRHVYGLSPEKKGERFRVHVTGYRWPFVRPSFIPNGLNAWSIILHLDAATAHTPAGAVPLPKNTLMLFPPGGIMHFTAPARKVRQSWIRIIGNAVPIWLRENALAVYTPIPLSPGTIEPWIIHIDEELSHPSPDAFVSEYLFRVLLRRIRTAAGPSNVIPGGIARAHDAIRANFMKPLSATALAAEAGYSRAYFIEQFTHHYGAPPMKYLTRVRMEYARYLLEDPAIPIGGIARECGYADIFHFSKVFKQYAGTSPKYLRAKRPRRQVRRQRTSVPLPAR